MKERNLFSIFIMAIWLLLPILLIVVAYSMVYPPVKYAVKLENLSQNEPYFLIKNAQVTGAYWQLIGDQNGMYDEGVFIHVKSGEPTIVKNLDFAFMDNTYVCYGKYVDDVMVASESRPSYEFSYWTILYPIKRNSIFYVIEPKSYIYKAEMR